MTSCQLLKQTEAVEKKAESEFSRKEKQLDDATTKKLEEVYGAVPKKHMNSSQHRLRRGWKCPACYYVNFESRNVCGECLEKNPAALRNRKKDADGKFIFSDAEDEKKKPNVKMPGKTLDGQYRILTHHDRCYRVFREALSDGGKKKNWGATQQQHATAEANEKNVAYDDFEDYEYEDDDDEEDGTGCGGTVATTGGNRIQYNAETKEFSLSLHIPPRYYKFIIGTKGATLQETQRLTGATVIIPKNVSEQSASATGNNNTSSKKATTSGSKDGTSSTTADPQPPVIIKALEKNAIRAAHIRLDSIMLQCREKVDYTHFLSIPLGSISSLQGPLVSLISDMSSACGDEQAHMDASIFQKPTKVHLTLLMLRLYTPNELNTAKGILRSLQDEINALFTTAAASKITLKGLNYMNDDPRDVHVVYLELEKDDTYAKLAQLIATINAAFVDSGLALEKDIAHNEKLHATIINSKWRNVPGEEHPTGRLSFDATNAFKLFGQVCLGTHKLGRVDLSILAAKSQQSEGGYYASEASIVFPQ